MSKDLNAMSKLVPKQRILTEDETVTSFESWKNTMIFHISIEPKCARFMDDEDLAVWKGAGEKNRGFTNDPATADASIKMSAVGKAAALNVMLGSIAHYAPVISNKFIMNQATSLEEIFDRLRAHYGFRRTGGKITELTDFKLAPSETLEALWECMYSFWEDSLLQPNCDITHMGRDITVAEEFSPTLLNVLVVLWLRTIHQSLPAVVRQRFATDLRDQTIFSIRDEISDSIPALLSDIADRDGSSTSISASFQQRRNFNNKSSNNQQQRQPKWKSRKPNCIICESAGRPSSHFLSKCNFLPDDDKSYFSKVRDVMVDDEEECEDEDYSLKSSCSATTSVPSVPQLQSRSAQTCRVHPACIPS